MLGYIHNTINDDLYTIISDYGDSVIIDYYGQKLYVKIGPIWERWLKR